MTKWEYMDYKWDNVHKCILTDGGGFTVKKSLDEMGEEGWEMVTIYDGTAYFKRPLNDNNNFTIADFNKNEEN